MKRKSRCNVCGARFEPRRERTVEKKSGFLLDITMTYYDVMDCPKCGCEITLQVRQGKPPPMKQTAQGESKDE